MIQAMILSALVVAICTVLHYGTLKQTSDIIARSGRNRPGRNLGLAVGAITMAHVVEALVYTLFFWWAAEGLHIGDLEASRPSANVTLMDYYYFSLVNFTTLGRGDLNPDGHLRFITGIEAFHGFLMITASGSFVLQVMAGKAPLTKTEG